MQPDRTGLADAGRLERALFAFGAAARLRRLVPKPVLPRRLRRPVQLLGWALTLRLPGELGYWLRARRLRGRAPRRLSLPASPEPVVSVIIPTYGKVWLTLRCLASIAAFPPAAAVEVIVVDDASGDPTLGRLRRVRGLRLLTTPRNFGFIGACNHAARFARGEFLLFLNNDTLVRTGWLDALLALLRARPDAGAAGSKLLYPTGRLQEAGGIIWRDATGANYGRGDDPHLPIYNYVREVDYCSGASLMVRRALFAELGGFDPHYAPAYYEDADLAFRLRARGHVTLYQPRSEVVHIEGASHGTDLRSGVKAHQAVNRHRFLARWKLVLDARHMPLDTRRMRARPRGPAHGRPCRRALRAGARPRRRLTDRARLPARPARGGVRGQALGRGGAARPGLRDGRAGHGDRGGRWRPGRVRDLDGGERARDRPGAPQPARSRRRASRHRTPPQPGAGRLLRPRPAFPPPRAQFALTGAARHAAEAARLERLERWLWRAIDRVLTPSEQEAVVARQLEPAARVAAVAPFCFARFGARRAPPPGARLLFVGGFAHTPNMDALAWFVAEILPLIRGRVPAARLLAVGSHVPPRVWALSGPAVTIRPDVPPDALRRLYLSARVVVAPLRYGAGVKLKVVEALRNGVPLVTTGVGAQGLPGLGRVACITDDPARFAEAVCRLLTDEAAWREHCAAQIAYARTHFSEAVLRDGLLRALDLTADGSGVDLPYRSVTRRLPNPSTVTAAPSGTRQVASYS